MSKAMIKKRVFRNILFLVTGLFWVLLSKAQIPVDSWRAHFSYSRSLKVALAGERIYCASHQGLFYFDQSDNSLGTLTKINGLSDAGVSAMAYSDDHELMIVGYENGNIDLVGSRRVINIPDILRKQIPGRKSINQILFFHDKAYLACGFGIVVISLSGSEVADSYLIGPGGSYVEVYDVETDGAFVYAATASGVFSVSIDSPNPADFNSWTQIHSLPEASATYSFFKWFGGKYYAVQFFEGGNDKVYISEGNSWDLFLEVSGRLHSLKVSADRLIVADDQSVRSFNDTGLLTYNLVDYGFAQVNPRDALFTGNNVLWVADFLHGLVKTSGTGSESIYPNGPATANAFHLYADKNTVYLSGGGYDPAWVNLYNFGELFHFSNEKWVSVIEPGVRDIVRAISHPTQTGLLYAASWGWGLLEYDGYQLASSYNPQNSSLQTIIPGDFCRVSGIAFDKELNLWMTNPTVSNPVSVKKADGTWRSFPYGAVINHHSISDLLYNAYGHFWALLPRGGGLFAFDVNGTIDDSNDDRTKKFAIVDENGSFLTNEVFSIAEDKNGFIWVGTNNGPVVYYNPGNVFTTNPFYARRIIIPGQNEGEGAYLLANETITAIAVDGANRKWFGTEKAGVFLISADGTGQIAQFNTSNSPLVSNQITSLAVHPKSGEVFIATSAGLVSYRGDATAPSGSFRNVLVFPNPVRPDFNGTVSISGLMDESNVKITDISGNLVYETVSLGGQASWDGRTHQGKRVRTGVYLVFLTTPDGSETHVTKLLFIH